MRIEALSPALIAAWSRLFETSSSPCYCRYWHFTGDKNTWLARCAEAPEKNRDEQAELVSSGDDRGRGLVALEGETCVGWMKLTPRASVPKLRGLPVYKSHDLGSDEGVWSIGCLLVLPSARHRGVARALIGSAAKHGQAWGARAIEAYPHVQEGRAADEQLWRGTLSTFLAAGFREVAGERPYPVLRLDLPC